MKAEVQAWLDTLRDPVSQKYQGKLENHTNANERCPLGHACHALGIYRKVGEWSGTVRYDSQTQVLPFKACETLGIDPSGRFKKALSKAQVETIVGRAPTPNNRFAPDLYENLAHLNDFSDITLSEIADLIEYQYAHDGFAPHDLAHLMAGATCDA